METESQSTMKPMPTWLPPRPMNDTTDFWKLTYPIKVYNSLTRTKVWEDPFRAPSLPR